MHKGIKEEGFFMFITWFHPVICGIFIAMLLGEDFLSSNELHTSLIHYSSCSKIPLYPGNSRGSTYYMVFIWSHVACLFVTFISQNLCFLGQRKLEKERDEGIMVETYNKDGVTISRRGPNYKTSRKLQIYLRTVVSPKASFVSFICGLSIYFLGFFLFLTTESSFCFDIIAFLHLSQLFFFHTLIETILSPTLLNSFIDFFPWSRRTYCVVNV